MQKSSTSALLYSESNTAQGQATVFETGYSYEYKAMDLQVTATYASSSISSEMPVNFGIRIGLDPFYWLFPQKK